MLAAPPQTAVSPTISRYSEEHALQMPPKLFYTRLQKAGLPSCWVWILLASYADGIFPVLAAADAAAAKAGKMPSYNRVDIAQPDTLARPCYLRCVTHLHTD